MPMRREQGTCVGRGFADTDENGWCAKLKAWITKSPINGGPGWFMLLDRSSLPVSKNITAVDPGTDTITVPNHGYLHGEPVRFGTTGTQMGGITTGTKYYIWYLTENTFKVCSNWRNFMSGTVVDITSAGSNNFVVAFGPYIVVSDKANPAIQDNAKIIKIGYETTVAGYVYCQAFLSKGITSNSHPLGVWAGQFIKTVDAGPFTYDFRGNLEFLVLQSRIPAEARWYRWLIDEWSPFVETCENDALVNGTVASNVSFTPGSPVVITLQNAAQVNALTKGQGYFIYYAGLDTNNNEVVKVNYGVIDKKGVADGLLETQIRMSSLADTTGTRTIMAGSRITPYWHRFITAITYENIVRVLQDFSYLSGSTSYLSSFPYCSYNSTDFGVAHSQSAHISVEYGVSVETGILSLGSQDNGLFIVQRPAIIEKRNALGQTIYMNRLWGELKNLFISVDTNLVDMETGRIINGKEYVSLGSWNTLSFGSGTSYHVLAQHTESLD